MAKRVKKRVRQVPEVSKETADDIEFKITRDADKVTGFTLLGCGSTEAECYCVSFVTAQARRNANISFPKGKVLFTHGGVPSDEGLGIYQTSSGGMISFDITPKDAEELAQLLAHEGKYAGTEFSVRFQNAFVKGFTLYLKQKEKKAWG